MQHSSSASRIDFSYLNEPNIRRTFGLGPNGNSIRFYVGGMRCAKCVKKIEDLSLTLEGLKHIRVELGRNLAYAEVDPECLSFAKLAEEIQHLGFKPVPISAEMSQEKAQKSEDRSDLVRLAVGGFCAGNIMTFSFASYFGDTGSLYPIFSWISFALYLPVAFYVATPFYVGAWTSLRQRHLSVDLPMAIASISGFLFSSVELLRGKTDIYFDSLSGFLFLILVARWLHKRIQRRFLRGDEIVESLALDRVRKMDSSLWTWEAANKLQPGDDFLLLETETVPADSELRSVSARFGLAWLSGEEKPKVFLKGATVPAGARLISGEASLAFQKGLSATAFGEILKEVQRFNLSESRLITKADAWAQLLLATVFTLAIAFLYFYWSVSPEEAIRRSLALIILACPCAMAFGTPLALAFALKKAHKAGIIIRNANAFEKAQDIHTIFFDKTGTLTETDLTLVECPNLTPSVYQKIILGLENESSHPIAFAFRKAFTAPEFPVLVENRREAPGIGVSGYIYGRLYEIGKTHGPTATMSCTLFEDKKAIHTYTFEAQLKPDCLNVIESLRKKRRLVLLSGDKKETVSLLGSKLGFSFEEMRFEMSPHDKALLVEQVPGAMMVGDGVNDSLAMMKASIGVATSGGVEAALRSSDIYLTDASLKGIETFFAVSESAMGLIRQNLTISAIYNVVGGVLALSGFINPMVAALLMPISSGFIVLATWIRSRA